ncbi:hypothetical protein [Photobacterium toruni]|uniref:hypothetical protein n=1 Tax=Photobacterium toruni TaxID=1935446 RepID=UPI00210FAC81|nr:hypothetical protein [Photobacterium toruni]
MKKKILVIAISSLFMSTFAQSATIYKKDNGDRLDIYGGAEIGGTIVTNRDKSPFGDKSKSYVDDSFGTIGIKGQTNKFYAKLEIDAERTDWTYENNFRLVIDKAYVGYFLTDKQTVEFGRTDTAYDHYDAFGDFSNELADEVSEAGDQDNTIKYRGEFGALKVGISYSAKGWDFEHDAQSLYDENGIFIKKRGSYITDSREGEVINGYAGYFTNNLTVIAAAETVHNRGELYSLHGKYKINKFAIGGFTSYSDRDGVNKNSMIYVLSGSYDITSQLTGYVVGNIYNDDNNDKDDQHVVIGTQYMYAKNVKLVAEAAMGGDTGTLGYLKAYYWF